jgi:hypothetical protein
MGYALPFTQEAKRMKLSVEQVAKLTKLSVPTLRVYASRQKLGKKEGNKRYFSQEDVKKLLKGPSVSGAKKKKAGKTAAAPTRKRKPAAAKKAAGKAARSPVKTSRKTAPPAPAAKRTEPVNPPVQKRSFWSRLFGGAPKQKVTLMDAKGLRR